MNTVTRKLVASLAAATVLSSTAAPALAQEEPAPSTRESLSMPLHDVEGPWVAAHRGEWRDYPENSIPAILKAAEYGAEIIEIDLKRTADGHLVLVHDETVDRTTNGTGKVSALTLAEIKELRLRQGQGNGPAPLTDMEVVTFEEALEAVKGKNILFNLDKGWEYREQLVDELEAADMLEYGLFKGSPTTAEAIEFMEAHPDAQYMHIINDKEYGHFQEFLDAGVMPDGIEVAFNTLEDPQADPEYLKWIDQHTDLWLNSMWNSVGGGYTDEASLRDPALGWQALVDLGADVIQTDNVRMISAWVDGEDVTRIGMKPSTIRVQAEDYINDPAFYHDADENKCATPIRDASSPVDACDLDGAHVVQYIRDGEHFTLEVQVDKPGMYNLSMRHSADTEPGGTVTVDAGDGPREPVALPNTTHNRAFTVTDLGKVKLDRGTHRLKFSFTHPDYASVDWIQLDRGKRADSDLTDMGIIAR